MKRIFFTQQKPYNYIPLRMGLGYLQAKEVFNYNGNNLTLVPKIYTTRSRPLNGKYYVVEGSRFKAKAVMPRIEFDTKCVGKLWLHFPNCRIDTAASKFNDSISLDGDWLDGSTFSELDLGFRGANPEILRKELLRLNPKTTIDTPFFVNRLIPISERQGNNV